MRRSLSFVFFLVGACVVLFGIALLEGGPLPPLPMVNAGPTEAVTATATESMDLERAGYTLKDTGADPSKSGRGERSYVFQGPSGFSAVLRDDQYPPVVSISRALAFDLRFSAPEGGSPAGMPEITPKLVAAAQKAVRHDAAVVAGLGYLATAAGPGVSREALQAAVTDYLRNYRQPSTPIQEACAGCGSRDGFGDEYPGGPDMHTALRHGWSGWEIAGIRHYRDGDSAFTVEVTVRVPRSQS